MTTNWIPGLVTLGVGVVAGTVALLAGKRQSASSSDDVDALQTRADKAIEALRELNADKHQYDEAQFATEKTRLEREAADALRERDKAKKAPTREAKTEAPRSRPTLIGALYGGGFVGLIWFLTSLIGAESSQKGGDAKYEALMVLSAISISVGDHEKILQFWEAYMNHAPPRTRPPMLSKAYDWLEKAISEDSGQ